MTNPDEKPSFLARLAVVVTFGVLALQLFGGVVAGSGIKSPDSSDFNLAVFLVGLFPPLVHSAVAGTYYLFKGAPTNADNVVKSRLFLVWTISYIVGAVFWYFIPRG